MVQRGICGTVICPPCTYVFFLDKVNPKCYSEYEDFRGEMLVVTFRTDSVSYFTRPRRFFPPTSISWNLAGPGVWLIKDSRVPRVSAGDYGFR